MNHRFLVLEMSHYSNLLHAVFRHMPRMFQLETSIFELWEKFQNFGAGLGGET